MFHNQQQISINPYPQQQQVGLFETQEQSLPWNANYVGSPVHPHFQTPNHHHQPHRKRHVSKLCPPSFCSIPIAAITIAVVTAAIGAATVVLFMVFRPSTIQVSVDSASLSLFDLTNMTATLTYNLSASFSLWNPKKRVGVKYDWEDVGAYYSDEQFAGAPPRDFEQYTGNAASFRFSINGSSVVKFDEAAVAEFRTSERVGIFDVELRPLGQMSYKYGPAFTRKYTAVVRCFLRLPLIADGSPTPAFVFTRTECDVDERT